MRAPLISPFRRVSPASIVTKPVQPGDNLRGAALMALSMFGFTCNDVVMKYVAGKMPLYEAITLRGLVVMLALLLIAWREGGLRLQLGSADRKLMSLRLIGEIMSTVFFLNALQHMAIGDLAAVMQSLPLVIMLSAAIIFGEQLGWRRTIAAAVGMAGVLLILRPGSGTFGIWALVAFGAVLMVALRDLATRNIGPRINSTTIAFYAATGVTLLGLVGSISQEWVMPSLSDLLWLLLSGLFLTGGYLTAVAAMRVGEISYVAPFRYVSLLVAIAAGLVVFNEWPDKWTWVGSALIVGAGIYSIWREAQLKTDPDGPTMSGSS